MRLAGKAVIVTGGAHGIGEAISRLFAEEGASVLITDIDAAAGEVVASEIREEGGQARFLTADVSQPASAALTVRTALEQWGHIEVLCNNAAHLGEFHDALGATADEWEKSIRVTLLGAHHLIREVLPPMLQQGNGSIINVASVQALVGGPTSVAYATVKAGLLGLTRSVAYDYGARNIRVNAICPGPVRTRISPSLDDESYRWQLSNTLLRRAGQPREVACAALFLASDESSFITGAVLPVDGGWTAM